MNNSNISLYSAIIYSCLLLFPLALSAGPQGRILGTVVDDSGNLLEDALIEVSGVSTAFSETYTTNKKGRFTATFTDATRDYKVTVSKEGYVSASDIVDVKVGEAIRLTWTLKARVEIPLAGDAKAIEAYNAGAAAFNAGDLEAAVGHFRSAIETDPSLSAAYETLSAVLQQAGRPDESAEIAMQWLDLEPENDKALTTAFDALVATGDSAQLTQLVDRIANSSDPQTPKRLFNAGAVAVGSGQRDLAKSLMAKALEVDPSFLEANSSLARIHAADGELEEAEKFARGALAIDPQDPGALIVLFDVHQRREEHDEAQQFLEVMKEADPLKASDILGEQANEYLNLGRLDIADQLSSQALELNPSNPKALFARASLALNNNEIEVARQRFEELIALAPESAQAMQAKEILDYL